MLSTGHLTSRSKTGISSLERLHPEHPVLLIFYVVLALNGKTETIFSPVVGEIETKSDDVCSSYSIDGQTSFGFSLAHRCPTSRWDSTTAVLSTLLPECAGDVNLY
jgi:hypothetical protein